jgi:CDP-diacylglycerol--serine O-phosphatidyltransferase
MSKLKAIIPNAFTLGNLFCGFAGIIFAFHGDLSISFWLILLAGFLDFWDGFLARKLGVSGDLGKQLDSLADVVSFGVLPSFILFSIMSEGGIFVDFLKPYSTFLPYLSGTIALSSAYRLAKFNIDPEQSENFKGLATPSAAILIGAIGWSFENRGFYYAPFWFNEVNLLFIILISWLLNSGIGLLGLKFKNFSWATNKFRYILLVLSALCLIFLSFESVPLILVLYIILSIIHFKTSDEI